LEANFDSVPLERRQRYTRIAKGSLRFAVYMCAHDSEIQASGNLLSALRDARSYYESWFSGQFGFDGMDREALEIVALVDRLGYRDDLAGQLNGLCSLLGRDPQDTRERIERIRTCTGFIAGAGRFYYVTPAPVAMVAFESKPFSTCVMTVFPGESSNPRPCRNCSTRGLISPSCSSLVLPVMTKSSA